MEYNICLIQGCRFPKYHLSSGHYCLKCGKFGHGRIECGNNDKMSNLRKLINNCDNFIIPKHLHCSVIGCKFRENHTTSSHVCSFCKGSGHSYLNCPLNTQSYHIQCPLCRTHNIVKRNQKTVTGLDTDCSVCYDNKACVYFPDCGHVTVCSTCAKELEMRLDSNYVPDQDNNIINNFEQDQDDNIINIINNFDPNQDNDLNNNQLNNPINLPTPVIYVPQT